jgi:alkylation response protein AidB-like acyl-CoA dehydrogenase
MKQNQITFSIDMKDIRFVLFDILKVQDLLQHKQFQHLSKDEVDDLLDRAQCMAIDNLSPLNKVINLTPPQFKNNKVSMPSAFHKAFAAYREQGWIRCTLDTDTGGMGLPEVLGMTLRDIFNGACGSFFAFSSLTQGALNLIHSFGSDKLKNHFVDKMASGIYTGTMCLTEPESGSYLADITTRAEKHGDCHGWLLGKEGDGLSQMFVMMNEMRLGTAVQGVGQAAAAYRMALCFAKARVQGLSYKRKKGDPLLQVPIIEHPDVKRNLLFMKSVVEGCRLLVLQTAHYLDLSNTLDDPTERDYYDDLVEILTPVCKAYATDRGFKVAETAVQTLGGYGYIKDLPVEQYLRDIKVACIYEGTNGIHAIDLLRRKLKLNDGRLFKHLLRELDGSIDQTLTHIDLGSEVGALQCARNKMVETANSFKDKAKEDPGLLLAYAKPFLDLTGHVLCTWMLLRSAVVANQKLKAADTPEQDHAFYHGKINTAAFAVSNFLPCADALADTIATWDQSILDITEDQF